MSIFKPLKGFTYNKEKVDIKTVIAPPYDVINEEQKEQLYKSSEYNICHIELPKGEDSNKYLHAKELINSWIDKKILLQENDENYYLYQQTFNLEGQLIQRRSILGLLEIHAFEDRIILPHENTMEGPKKDRYSLLEATQANISPIFCMCNDETGDLFQLLENYSQTQPTFTTNDVTETQHDLWKINDVQVIQKINELGENKKFIILDGHHRYTTALNYKNNNPNEKNHYVLTALVPDSEPGLKILPIHRMLTSTYTIEGALAVLEKDFEINKVTQDKITIHSAYDTFEENNSQHGFLLTDNKQFYTCMIKQEKFDKLASQSFEMNLDTFIVDEMAIKKMLNEQNIDYLPEQNVNFVTNFDEITSMFNQGSNNLCFLVQPLPIKTIVDFTERNMVMPHKTTYLYPKIGSGFVINKF
ncbi:MAG: hypothetical protein CL779_03420 [Chloroflexi bacterium]|nr:hypothetical protein [Chloroflexota bacterium]